MLVTIRDDSQRILACLEWWLVDDLGQWNPHGHYVWINKVELSPLASMTDIARECIAHIACLCPEAKGAYWKRELKTGHQLHGFRRDQLMKYLRWRQEVMT